MRDYAEWLGRQQEEEDSIDHFSVRAMRAVLDRDPDAIQPGDPLPPGWHWLYFRPVVRRSALGEDGHEQLGGFLPVVDLPRRMWAGGSLEFRGDLRVGERVRRLSTVESVEEKQGRSGRLVFVSLRHQVETERGLAVDEEQHLVYREAGGGGGGATPGPPPPEEPAWSVPFTAGVVTLFRFSALTFNAHRIHYDRAWATEEGYPGLLVHGPLLALLLLDSAAREGGRSPARFAYRAVSPLFVGEEFRLEGAEPLPRDTAGETQVWVAGPRGTAMRAMAGWEPG